MLKDSVISVLVEEDARQRIENVVEKYQSDGTRTNFTMETSPKWKCDSGRVGMVLAMFLVSFLASIYGIFMFPGKDFNVIMPVFPCVMFIWLLSMLYINTAGRFKVKVWRNDHVGEADILYLCENHGLKMIIRAMIANGDRLTYTDLNHHKFVWMGEIAGLRAKALREELVKKIDQVEERR